MVEHNLVRLGAPVSHFAVTDLRELRVLFQKPGFVRLGKSAWPSKTKPYRNDGETVTTPQTCNIQIISTI